MHESPFCGGEWLAILRLKVVSTTHIKRPNWFPRDCVPAAQSQSEKYLRRMARQEANGWRFFTDSCSCFVTQLPSLIGKHEILIVSEPLFIRSDRRQATLPTSRLPGTNPNVFRCPSLVQ